MRALCLVLLGACGGAAASAPAPAAPPRPDDVSSIDGMVKAYYDVVSGPKGQPRDWARDRSLYVPGVRFVFLENEKGKLVVHNLDHAEFEASSGFLEREGFFEQEVKRETWQWGRLAQVRSSYETRRTADGPIIGRGVNTIELVHDGRRWWIAGATWQSESPELPLPPALDRGTP